MTYWRRRPCSIPAGDYARIPVSLRTSILALPSQRRDYAGLRKQIYSYGIGPIAVLTKTVLENPLLLFHLIAKVPYGLFFILSSRSPKNQEEIEGLS